MLDVFCVESGDTGTADDGVFFKVFGVGGDAPVGGAAPEDGVVKYGGFEMHGVVLASFFATPEFDSGIVHLLAALHKHGIELEGGFVQEDLCSDGRNFLQ